MKTNIPPAPYYSSLGDPEARGVLAFFLGSHYPELPRRSAIPMEVARRTIRAFARPVGSDRQFNGCMCKPGCSDSDGIKQAKEVIGAQSGALH
jgi:hypothetical protein